jgi:glucose/arabinose dehydrogenase
MRKRAAAVIAASIVSGGAIATAASAAGGPPPPKAFGHAKVSQFASGLMNPTSFAWGDGAMFAGDSGNSQTIPNGGVYVVKHGTAKKIPSSVLFVGGMQFHKGTLYLSVGDLGKAGPQFQILAWKGWNGTTFTSQKAIYTAPKGFQGFNGIAFGPDGRLYVGVDLGLTNGNDHGPASLSPYLYDILSMKTNGKGLKVFAKGIRQPWQMAFAPGSKSPFVSDLGQDGPIKHPKDFVLKVSRGQNYGFPHCPTKPSTCKRYAKPFKSFAPHTDIMGLAVIGKTLYMGSFLGADAKSGGALYSMPVKGGKVRPVVIGFPLATDALAAHGGALYVGGSTQQGEGFIYRVKP